MISALSLLALAASPVLFEPATLRFGAEPEAVLVVVAPGAKSVTASCANGVGSISAAERIADGRFRVRFTFPKERFPQLALIRVELEAEAGARSRAWAALPLIANADLKIETKPRATVTVTIGEKTFGPATAGANGRLTIPAQVPPGFATATVLAVDRAGNQTTRPLDLLTRPFARAVAVLASGAEAIAGAQTPLEVFAVEPDGRPLESAATLRVTAKRGEVQSPVAQAGGVFTVAYRAPASVAAGPDLITVGLEGAPATTRLDVKLGAGPPVRLELTLSPPAITAGSGLTAQVRSQAVDALGNPVDLPGVAYATDFGRLEPAADAAVLRIPDGFEGRSIATVTGRVKGLTGEAKLALVAADVARAELEFPPRIAAGETQEGQVFLADRFGNPVEGAAVTAGLTSGRAATVAEKGKGSYVVTLTTDREDPPGEHGLSVSIKGSTVAQARLNVRHFVRRWAFSVAATGFLQSNFSQWVSGGPRLTLGLRAGGTGLDVVVEVGFGAYAQLRKARAADGSQFDIQLQQLSLLVGARYWFPIGVRPSLQLSLLVGQQGTARTVTLSTGETRGQSEAGFALRAGAGPGLHLGPGRVLLQLEYTLAPISGIITGNAGGPGLSLGYVASF